MTTTTKRYLLFKSLRKQLSTLEKSLQDFGFAVHETYCFLIEVIFSHEIHQNPQDSHQQHQFNVMKLKSGQKNVQLSNLVDSLIDEIQSRQKSNKQILKYIHNAYATNSCLIRDSFISLASNIPKKHQPIEKLEKFWEKVQKNEKPISQLSKKTFDEQLHHKKSFLFGQESMFRRNSYQIENQEDSDEQFQFDNSQLGSRIDSLMLMQQEINRAKEMQRKYKRQIEAKVVQKRKLLDSLNSPITMKNRSEFASIFAQNIRNS